MTYDELVENVARAMKPTISSIVDRLIEIGADRLEAIQLLPLQEATVAIATIREALQEPTDEMSRCTLLTKHEVKLYWPELLAASALGKQSE